MSARFFSFSAKPEIRNGNLKAILGLFFTLSRFRQQQQTLKQASSNVQLLQNNQTHRCSSPALPPHSPPCPSPIHQHYTSSPCAQKPQTDLQSRYYSPTRIACWTAFHRLHDSWTDTSLINFKSFGWRNMYSIYLDIIFIYLSIYTFVLFIYLFYLFILFHFIYFST